MIGVEDDREVGAEVERDVLFAGELPADIEDVIANPDEVETVFDFEGSRAQFDIIASSCYTPFLFVVIWVLTQFDCGLKSCYSSMISTYECSDLRNRRVLYISAIVLTSSSVSMLWIEEARTELNKSEKI